jgi:hypothetical protein
MRDFCLTSLHSSNPFLHRPIHRHFEVEGVLPSTSVTFHIGQPDSQHVRTDTSRNK